MEAYLKRCRNVHDSKELHKLDTSKEAQIHTSERTHEYKRIRRVREYKDICVPG